jgi:hypothetical protein
MAFVFSRAFRQRDKLFYNDNQAAFVGKIPAVLQAGITEEFKKGRSCQAK